jgi:streptomycin 6-kinase
MLCESVNPWLLTALWRRQEDAAATLADCQSVLALEAPHPAPVPAWCALHV